MICKIFIMFSGWHLCDTALTHVSPGWDLYDTALEHVFSGWDLYITTLAWHLVTEKLGSR